MVMITFFSKLEARIREIDSLLCIGLDPHLSELPELTGAAAKEFCTRIIDATADVQYMISKHISLSLGYRYLQIDFKEEDFLYEVNLKGARIALGIHF